MKKTAKTISEEKSNRQINRILLDSQNSSSAFQKLFARRKAEIPSLSLGMACRIAGIPSRGYLHDVLAGRRILRRKYLQGISKVFRLNKTQERFLELLAEIDSGRARRGQNRLAEELRKIRLILEGHLEINVSHLGTIAGKFHLAQKLAAALRLFPNGATVGDLALCLGKRHLPDIVHCLEDLSQAGLASRNGEMFFPSTPPLHYIDGFSSGEIESITREGLLQTCPMLPKLQADSEETLFSQVYLAVDLVEYKKALRHFLHDLKRFHSQLAEGKSPEKLVAISVQSFVLPTEEPN